MAELLETIVGGLARASYLVPFLIAAALVARHGRYLPLWVPAMGTVSAYVAYWLGERQDLGGVVATGGAVAAAIGAGLLLHRLVFAGHVSRHEPYPALLRGVALVMFIEAALGLVTGGYALAYERISPLWECFIPWPVNNTVRVPDVIAVLGAVALAPLLHLFIERTRSGLTYRATASNRELASEYGHPVRLVDLATICAAALLAGTAGIIYGLHYGLAPGMLSSPTLDVIAVLVAAGNERLRSASLLLVGVCTLQALVQGNPSWSGFEHAVAYVVLVAGLFVRHGLPRPLRQPMWHPQSAGDQ